jgi:hypothetical protein
MEPIVPDQLIVDALEQINVEALEQLRAARNVITLTSPPPEPPGTDADFRGARAA